MRVKEQQQKTSTQLYNQEKITKEKLLKMTNLSSSRESFSQNNSNSKLTQENLESPATAEEIQKIMDAFSKNPLSAGDGASDDDWN